MDCVRVILLLGWAMSRANHALLSCCCQLAYGRALPWAQQLGHSKTYDARCLALAEREGVEPWTADRRLANSAQEVDAPRAHWIGEVMPLE